MAQIDERVVAVAFETAKFDAGVTKTISGLKTLSDALNNMNKIQGLENLEKSASKITLSGPMSALDKLKGKLGSVSAGTTFSDLERDSSKVTFSEPARAADKLQGRLSQISGADTFSALERESGKVSFEGLSRAIDGIGGKFSAMTVAAGVAFGNLATQIASKVAGAFKNFSIGPITEGFNEYATNLSSIQTILANTQQSGATLDDVNAALQDLNKYSDQTIYNFGQMANSIGLFTAAGVDLDTSTAAIKGISNLAALSGSSAEKATTAMQQLAQAISSGKVGLQDWNSVVTAGMGGSAFQRALATTAENMGTLSKGSVELKGKMKNVTVQGQSFRDSIMAKPGEKSWLTSDVLTSTLKQFTGDMTDAELAAQGFTAEQIKSIQQTAKTAKNAATEVKTIKGVFDVAKEAIGTGWSDTFSIIFGNFGEAKATFTELSKTLGSFIGANASARNKMLQDWKDLGGREIGIDALKKTFGTLMTVIQPLKDAFRDIFPATTGKQLFELTKNFRDFIVEIRPSTETIDRLRRIFAGMFAAVDIGWNIIKTFVGVIFDLLGVVGKGSGGFVEFIAKIGDFLVGVDNAIKKGDGLKNFFETLGAVLKVPLNLIVEFGKALLSLFPGDTGGKAKSFEDTMGGLKDKLGPLKGIIDKIVRGWNDMVDTLGKVKDALEPWVSQVAEKIGGIADVIADVFKNMDYNKVMAGLQTGFLGGIFLVFKKAFKGGLPSVFGDSLEGVNDLLKGFTNQLSAMQRKVQAETLLLIAAAVVALAGGIFILSTIDGPKLQKAMLAVAVGLGELMGAMKLMTAGMGKLAVLQLPFIAAGMIGLALAVTILAGAMKIFATMKWEDIGKGIVGVAGSIAAIGLAMNLMPPGPQMILQSAGLFILGLALNAIAVAVKQFASMKWEEMGQGLFGVIEALGILALTMNLMPPNIVLTAAGLLVMGFALSAIAGAVEKFGSMDILTMLKGLGAVGAAIALIGLAVGLVPPYIGLTAVGMLLMGEAMIVMAGAVGLMGSMDWGTILKGLVGIAGALIVLAAGLTLMIVALPGAAALMVAAGALAVLVPVLGLLGTMKWSTIFKGLGAIALVLITIGVAGLIAAPALLALGVALIPLGIGMILVATAAKLFSQALEGLGDSGKKGVAILIASLTAFIAVLPKIIISFIEGFVGILGEITKLAPKIVQALGVIIDMIIAFVIASAPSLAIAIGVLVDSILMVLVQNTPKIIAAGAKILMDLLNGLSQNIGQVTTKVAEIIQKFLAALASKAPALAAGGVNLLNSFLRGITSKIPEFVQTVTGMVGTFLKEMGKAIPGVVKIATDLIVKFINAVSNGLDDIVNAGKDLIIKFLDGIGDAIPDIRDKALEVAEKLLTNLSEGLVGMADIGFKAIIDFLNGLAEAIRNNDDQLIDAGANILDALVDGLVKAAGRMGPLIHKAINGLFGMLPKWAKDILGIHSPSVIFAEIGMNTMLGFTKGAEDQEKKKPLHKVVTNSAEEMIKKIKDILGIHSPSEVMRDIGKEVGHGFSDGLRGSADDIRGAFGSLNDKLKDQIRTSKQTILEEQGKLDDLLKAKKPDYKAIAASQKAIASETDVLNRSRAARAELTRGLAAEKAQLIGLTKQYEDVTKKLDDAQAALVESQRIRDDYKKSLTEQFAATPEIGEVEKGKKTPEQVLADYKKGLQDRIIATKKYAETLQQLRALGLDDVTYKKLLDEGTKDQDFATALLAGGATAVQGLNQLDTQLMAESTTLATDAAKNLYQAGVDAAQGLVNGLTAQKDALHKAMEDLADAMVTAIKRKLRIKSPSKVFGEVGKFLTQGLAEGLTASSKAVTDAATKLGADTITAMKSSIAGISSAIADNIDASPVITPVLDLTNVEKGAQKLGDLTNVTPITAAASYGQAAAISAAQAAAPPADGQAAQAAQVTFNQYNTSPEALTDIEIYRQTNNQLAQLKGKVGLLA